LISDAHDLSTPQLIRALARQLRGRLTHDVDGGTRFMITCPRWTPD
jgi:two-component sensor histidine kinase